jgi:hypothetical protein
MLFMFPSSLPSGRTHLGYIRGLQRDGMMTAEGEFSQFGSLRHRCHRHDPVTALLLPAAVVLFAFSGITSVGGVLGVIVGLVISGAASLHAKLNGRPF